MNASAELSNLIDDVARIIDPAAFMSSSRGDVPTAPMEVALNKAHDIVELVRKFRSESRNPSRRLNADRRHKTDQETARENGLRRSGQRRAKGGCRRSS